MNTERWDVIESELEAALDQIAVQNVNVRDDIAYLLERLGEAEGLLRWFNTSHEGTPDYRILREQVAVFLSQRDQP